MSNSDCSEADGARALMAQETVSELFQIAALMLGNEQEAADLVEETVATVEADPCSDARLAHEQARAQLVAIAVRRMTQSDPGAFAVPISESKATCIDADDLSAAGLTEQQLSALIQGPGRAKLRDWLEQLPLALRAVFVLRAVVGQDGECTAEGLRRNGGSGAAGWTGEQVGTAYRQALCSLATSLVSANSTVPA
jgi:DNA-directed RNA polymerase specialized sigma24 family protein